MNIFGIGGTELILILLIMMVVAGPKRMVHWAYYIGKYVAKFRQMWEQVVDVVQAEIDEAGLDVKIPKELPTRQNINKYVTELAKPYTKELEKSLEEVKKPLQETLNEADKVVKKATDDVKKVTDTANKSIKSVPVYGAWGQSKTPDDKPATKPDNPAADNGNYGAWSNPQHPGSQIEHEA